MLATLTSHTANQMAVNAYLALDHGRALEWIEAEALFADCQQTLGLRAAGGVGRDHGTNPSTLQAVPSSDLTGLKPLAEIVMASSKQHDDK